MHCNIKHWPATASLPNPAPNTCFLRGDERNSGELHMDAVPIDQCGRGKSRTCTGFTTRDQISNPNSHSTTCSYKSYPFTCRLYCIRITAHLGAEIAKLSPLSIQISNSGQNLQWKTARTASFNLWTWLLAYYNSRFWTDLLRLAIPWVEQTWASSKSTDLA